MSGRLELTILGCGSSGGVPRGDGDWGACDPSDPRNHRLRCSLLLRRIPNVNSEDTTTVLVDTSPDLRAQALAAGVRHVDAVLFTHDHADQTHGIDDLRVFALRGRRRVPCWMDEPTLGHLSERFGYIFKGGVGYPPICEALRLPPDGEPWAIDGPSGVVPVTTFEQVHGPISSVGYRFGPAAYSSDVSGLSETAKEALEGLDLWIVDALRWTPHPTHADVGRTLGWIRELEPKRAVLTNLHIDLDYRELARQLPSGVEPAFDGWTDTVEIEP